MTRGVLLLLLLLAASLPAPAHAAEPPPLDEAVAAARAAGRPLVLQFSTDWCGPCKEFDAKILPDAKVQAALAVATYIHYDAEKGPGIAAARRYGVSSYPTVVVVDGAGEALARFEGAPPSPEPFLAFLDKSLPLALDEAAVEKTMKDKQASAGSLLAAARWFAARGRDAEALAAYDRAIKLDKKGAAGVAAPATWESGALRRKQAGRAQLIKDAAAFVEKFPGAAEAGEALAIAAVSGELPAKRVKKLFALRLDAAHDDPPALNDLTYLALAVGELDVALAAALRQQELRPADPNAYDTLAEAYHYRGDKSEALAWADRGIKIAPPALAQIMMKNRERFARGDKEPSPDVEAYRKGALAALEAGAGGGQPAAAAAEEPSPPPTAEQEQAMAFLQAARAAYFRARDACAGHAGKLDEVYVRIELSPKGGKPTRVVVLEPEATPKLSRCLEAALGAETLPAPPIFFEGRWVAPVTFKKSGVVIKEGVKIDRVYDKKIKIKPVPGAK